MKPPLVASTLAAIALCICPASATVAACICCPVVQTFTEEMDSMDVVVFVRLRELPPAPGPPIPGLEAEIPLAKFEVVRSLKGGKLARHEEMIEARFYGDPKLGGTYLLMGVEDAPVMWSTALQLSKRAETYMVQLTKEPLEPKEQCLFFQSYLEDADELLARDAFDELNKFSYDLLIQIKDQMPHDKLVTWVKSKETPASRRRLYARMLGICGGKQDVPMLEAIIKSENKKERNGLEGILACYLALQGTAGMELIEERFLKDKKADYAETYAAIMALRMHEREAATIRTQRIVQAYRLMLDRPDLADLVIPDLARLGDWEQVDRLFEMFKKEEPKANKSWLRVPIIVYLHACPLPKAQGLLWECEKIDPQAMKRARTFFNVPPLKPPRFALSVVPAK